MPPELLHMILSEFLAQYLEELFFTPCETKSECQTLTPNPMLALLQVSHRFREITFKILGEILQIKRNADGS